ncbi:MAG: c-type cytochrome [Gemmatimonadaceae bacterium]|nr:c-type cytochrome [Gemmatimonadaceae bacterium]MCW5826604.1 c-type cytochrome [Gemmatimonadaceae bacterium]
MNRLLKWIGYAAASLTVLVLVAATAAYAMSERTIRARYTIDAPLFAQPLPNDSATIAEGERIARTRGCFACHGDALQGGVFFSEPNVATVVAPNLTRLVPTRSDAELERALRHGVRGDSTSLFTMPAEMLRSLTDDDLARLLAFLRSLPSTDGMDGALQLGPLGRVGVALGQFRPSRYYVETETPLPPPSDTTLRTGHYAAITMCTECHGHEMQGVDGSPSLPGILPAYTLEEFTHLMRSGEAKGGRELPMMSGVSRNRFAHLTADEMEGLFRYLRALGESSGAP